MQLDYDDVHRLVLKMREGSREAWTKLIEAHVGLAFRAAEEFDDDESLSDALSTLVDEVCLARTSSMHPAALPSYLKVAVNRAAARHKRTRKGKRDGAISSVHNAYNDAQRFLHSGRSQDNQDPVARHDLMDQLLALCEVPQEEQMVYYKSLGMTYAEVAAKIGASTTHVARSMHKLSLRFQVQERLGA